MSAQIFTNPYRGINAHLNSLLQTSGTKASPSLWHSFHTSHIGNITDFLNDILPANYVARPEQSLQIRTEAWESVEFLEREPDVSIYGRTGNNPLPSAVASVPHEMARKEALDVTEHFIKAAVIREIQPHVVAGRVVARIELLSPTNKPDYSGYDGYRTGRNEALFSFVPLIELDYLHETLLPYNAPRTKAYAIIVSDPRPSVDAGRAKLYDFDLDEPFPVVNIPLAGDDQLTFDFGKVYQHTFERGRWGTYCDYSSPPARFGTYSPADQERIRAVMQRVSTS
ncbi:MAG TPA: DUF4058 family protein [Phototrophicaceae bacterium]|nr:DUF4058 family protein [Phototrophicaceae bacterium]